MSAGHFLNNGDQTGLDFTTGGATTADGIYIVTVLDAYNFTVAVAGSGASGNVTSRPYIAVTLAGHINYMGFQLLCDFTTGTGVDGTYEVAAYISTSVYWLKYPHVVNLTSGNVTVYKGVTVTTAAAHNLAIGNRISLDFTTGTAPDGIYTIETVPTTTTFTVNIPANVTAGNVTANWQIGYVPPAGCRTRIPNIIGRQCVNTTRSVNAAPHGTIATRPEFATTSAGYLDIEFFLTDWYLNLSQPYYTRIVKSATFDQISLTECATYFELDEIGLGMHSAIDTVALNMASNFAGGYIGYASIHRGNLPGAADHAVSLAYCNNITIDGLECGILQYSFPLLLYLLVAGVLISLECRDLLIPPVTIIQ
jgi:hypothetical protein